MAVEASSAGGEILKRDELEEKKEREMGGDFEHIACRGADDYDSNETESSFVMVKSGVDSDGRSDSSEKEIDLDVGGGLRDPQDAGGVRPSSVANSDSSTFGDYERVVEGKIEKGMGKDERKEGDSFCYENDEGLGEGGDRVQDPEVLHVKREEIIVDSSKMDHELKDGDVIREVLMKEEEDQKKGLDFEDLNDGGGKVTEDLSEGEGLMVVCVSKNEDDVMVFDDLKDVQDVSEDRVSEGMEATIVQNVEGISCEGYTIRPSSNAFSGGDDVKFVQEESEDVESSGNRPESEELEVVSEIEEDKKVLGEKSGDAEFSVSEKKEIDSAPEITERGDLNDELEKDIVTTVMEPEKDENLISDFEDERKINDEEGEDVEFSVTELTIDEGSKEAESSITVHVVQNIANDNLPGHNFGENESDFSIQEDEKQQDDDASLVNPVNEDKEDDTFIDLVAHLAKENICSSSKVEHQVAEVSTVDPSPASIDKAINLSSQLDDQHDEASYINNQKSRDSPTNSDFVDRDLKSSVEQIQQQDDDIFLSKCNGEGKEHDSSIESVAETIKDNIDSSSISEEYQAVGASSIDQNPDNTNHDVVLDIQAENKHVESTESESVDINWTQEVDTSLSKSDGKDKEHALSLDLVAESDQQIVGASSVVEKYMSAEASSIGQCPVSVDDISLASLAENTSEAISTTNQRIINSSTDTDIVDRDFAIYAEQEPLKDCNASMSKSDSDENEHDSSNDSITEPAKENIVSLIVEEAQAVEASSNDESPDRVNKDFNLSSRAEDIEPLSSPTQFDSVNRNLKSSVECLQHRDASISKSDSKEKEYDSYIEFIAEPAKENISSFSTGEYPVVEASSIGQSPESVNDDDSLASRVEDKHIETLSIENSQSIALPVNSGSVDRDLSPSVETVQQQDVDVSLTKSAIEEKDHDSSTELVAEPFKEDIGSSSIVEEKERDSCIEFEPVKENNDSSSIPDKYHVVESSSFVQSPERVEDINLTSPTDDEHAENLTIEGNLVDFKEKLVSTDEADKIQNDEPSSIYSNLEPEEEGGLASKVERNQVDDVSFINSNPKPIQMHMFSTCGVVENHDENLDLKTESIIEVASSASKSEVNCGSDSFSTKGVEDIVAEGSQKKELKAATIMEEPLETHIDKDLGAVKEQQEEFKSKKKQASVHIEQYQGSSAPSPSDCDGEKSEMHAKKYYIIKVPRFTQRVIDNELQHKMHEAQMKVNENTHSRDTIKVELENMRKVLSDCCHKRDSAIEEERKTRILVNAKRQEMDSLQSVISKGKTAASFLEIASQIHQLAHKMQHETISLKEEKKFMHELKQLEVEQEQHSFNKCSQSEIDEALKQKTAAESSLKALKKEFDLLRSAHLKADEFAKSASKNYINQFHKVKEHEKQWRTANELRQTAYKDLHGLKSDKMDHFWRYMDDRQAARKYASSRDIDALDRHCTEQIERVLQLWKEEEDFRRQYIESNVNSTLRRFGTLDGRTLGLNETAVVLPNRIPPPTSIRSLFVPVKAREAELGSAQEIDEPALQPKKLVRSKPSSKSTSIENTPAIVSVKEEIVEAELEKKVREEEIHVRLEEEKERKEEELRKEREAVELKEKTRLEQKAKAREAEERKRRKSEKARARADYKAQKAAELRELKRAKKEKKKEDLPETTGSVEDDSVSVTEVNLCETSQEPERTSKRSVTNKYSNRVQPVPLPLRNKGKRKTSMIVWTLCGTMAVGGLLFAGTYISFSDISARIWFPST